MRRYCKILLNFHSSGSYFMECTSLDVGGMYEHSARNIRKTRLGHTTRYTMPRTRCPRSMDTAKPNIGTRNKVYRQRNRNRKHTSLPIYPVISFSTQCNAEFIVSDIYILQIFTENDHLTLHPFPQNPSRFQNSHSASPNLPGSPRPRPWHSH